MTEPTKSTLVGERVRVRSRGKKGIYTADFWHDGKHHRRSLKTRNLKIARQRALKFEAQLLDGSYQPGPPPMPLAKVIDEYVAYLRTENRRPKTVTRYEGVLRTFQTFAEDNNVHRLTQVTMALVDKYRAFRKPNLSLPSMHTEAVMLKTLFKWARHRKYLRENPLESMKFTKPISRPRGGPSLAEVQTILAMALEPDRTHYAVLAFTGMRSGELRRLRVEDVDLEGNWIHIMSREGAETKTGLSRKVPIHPNLRPLLAAVSATGSWFFTAPPSRQYPQGGHWINTTRLNQDFVALLTKAGVKAGRKTGGFSIHSLRNSFETICVNAGIPQRVVDTWLGHRSDRSMASVYYKLTDSESQAFMLKVPLGTGEPAADASTT